MRQDWEQPFFDGDNEYIWDRLAQTVADVLGNPVDIGYFDARTGEFIDEQEELGRDCDDFAFEVGDIVQIADANDINDGLCGKVLSRSGDETNFYLVEFFCGVDDAQEWIEGLLLARRRQCVLFSYPVGSRVHWGDAMTKSTVVGYLPGHSPVMYRVMMRNNGELKEAIIEESEIRGEW